jgi:hypothetical protein
VLLSDSGNDSLHTPRTPEMAANTADSSSSGQHELDDMADKKPSLPVEEDIMQLARLGEIGAIQKLFDSGKFDATYTDEQGITPLHVRTRTRTLQYCYIQYTN